MLDTQAAVYCNDRRCLLLFSSRYFIYTHHRTPPHVSYLPIQAYPAPAGGPGYPGPPGGPGYPQPPGGPTTGYPVGGWYSYSLSYMIFSQ